jgi:hypothetical protein
VVESSDVRHDGELELRAGAPDAVGDQSVLRESTKLSARALMLLVGAHVPGELPADDPSAVGVQDEGEEHDAPQQRR